MDEMTWGELYNVQGGIIIIPGYNHIKPPSIFSFLLYHTITSLFKERYIDVDESTWGELLYLSYYGRDDHNHKSSSFVRPRWRWWRLSIDTATATHKVIQFPENNAINKKETICTDKNQPSHTLSINIVFHGLVLAPKSDPLTWWKISEHD
jgi:hypothetical protein